MSAKVEGSVREQGKLRIRMKAGMRTRDSKLGSQVFEQIADLQAGSVKVFVVAGDDREVVPTGRSRNIAVFNRHSPAPRSSSRCCSAQTCATETLKLRIRPCSAAIRRVNQACSLPLASLVAAHPVGKLRKNHCTGVAVVLFSLEPSRHAMVRGASRVDSRHRRRAASSQLGPEVLPPTRR